MEARKMRLAERARSQIEQPDPVPVEVPVSRRPDTLRDQIRQAIRQEFSRYAETQGNPSFEDEDDFDDDDPQEFASPYELSEMQAEALADAPHLETIDGPPETTPPQQAETEPPQVDDTGGNA